MRPPAEVMESMTSALLINLCGLCVAGLLLGEYKDKSALRWVFKSAASAVFIAFAWMNGALTTDYGVLIFIGLIFCMVGDILLIPKNNTLFLAGMGAFALGHGAYAFAFTKIWAGLSSLSIVASLLVFVAVSVTLRYLWPHLGSFRLPVAAYCLIITLMTELSFSTGAPGGGAPYWLAAGGAVAFAASDIAVARDQFVKRTFFNRLWGLPLYYAAQLSLAASVSL